MGLTRSESPAHGPLWALVAISPFYPSTVHSPRSQNPSLKKQRGRGGEKPPPDIRWRELPALPPHQAMDLGDFEYWGVVVRPGETLKCDPGEIYCHISQIALHTGKGNEDVRVFVKVAGLEILLGTLSVDKYPQYTTDLVFDKEFELLHTSQTSNISVIGYKFSGLEKRSDASSEGDEDSDDEAPLAIPLYSNADDDKRKETKDDEDKAASPVAAATQSSKPKAALEETKNPGKLKDDVGGNYEHDSEQGESDDDEDSSDEDDGENSDKDNNERDFPEKAKAKQSPAETPSKTPPVKKAKVDTSSPVDHKTGSGTAKKSGHIHVATPYPSKQVKKGNRR